jgi:hypothetical protein
VIDDASTDDTEAIVRRYGDTRIVYHRFDDAEKYRIAALPETRGGVRLGPPASSAAAGGCSSPGPGRRSTVR